MKYILTTFLVVLTLGIKAQDYADSTQYGESAITLQLTQSAANYLAETVQERFSIATRHMPDAILPFMGSGNNPDSTFTVTLQAKFVVWMLESLMARHNVIYSGEDFNKIVNGIPVIPGYTALATQVVNKANQAGAQQNAARYIRDIYIRTMAAQQAVKAEDWNRRRQLFKN